MLTMLASLLVASAPALVALGDVTVSVVLALRLTSAGGHHVSMGVRNHLRDYGFRTSLLDIPIVSITRSLTITCESSHLIPFHFILFPLSFNLIESFVFLMFLNRILIWDSNL